MRVTVLYGGPSAEREVSLVSGKAVIDGLQQAGHEVFAVRRLADRSARAWISRPTSSSRFFTASSARAASSRRSSSSAACRSSAAGRPPRASGWTRSRRRWPGSAPACRRRPMARGDAQPAADARSRAHPRAVRRQGRSTAAAASTSASARPRAEARRGRAIELLAQARPGAGRAVHQGPRADRRPARRKAAGADPDRHQARVLRLRGQVQGQRHRAPLRHRPARRLSWTRCSELARRANEVVGCRDLARIDIMIDAASNPYLLEINTLPGFTPKSLLPEAAAHAGIDFVHARGSAGKASLQAAGPPAKPPRTRLEDRASSPTSAFASESQSRTCAIPSDEPRGASVCSRRRRAHQPWLKRKRPSRSP